MKRDFSKCTCSTEVFDEKLNLLSELFENIFICDHTNNTMEIFKTKNFNMIGLTGIRIAIDDAFRFFVTNFVYEEDRNSIRNLFEKKEQSEQDRMGIQFRGCINNGEPDWFFGRRVELCETISCFCFNNNTQMATAKVLHNEIETGRLHNSFHHHRTVASGRTGITIFEYNFLTGESNVFEGFNIFSLSGINASSEDLFYEIKKCVHPDDRHLLNGPFSLDADLGQYLVCELRLRLKDGTYRWNLCTLNIFYNKDTHGKEALIITALDIQERKEFESRQQEYYECLSVLLQGDKRQMIVYSLDGEEHRYHYISHAALPMFEVNENDFQAALTSGATHMEAIKSDPFTTEELRSFAEKEGKGYFPVKIGDNDKLIEKTFYDANLSRYYLRIKESYPAPAEEKPVVRCFGYFDVFVNGKAVLFPTKKAKEYLAILIDRRGGYVNTNEAISMLWEDEGSDATTQARFRKVAMKLNRILEDNGISDIVETINGNRRIVVDKINCDFYNYLEDPTKNKNRFSGAYLSNYSWAEPTLAELLHNYWEE